jgi:hypothetical protein
LPPTKPPQRSGFKKTETGRGKTDCAQNANGPSGLACRIVPITEGVPPLTLTQSPGLYSTGEFHDSFAGLWAGRTHVKEQSRSTLFGLYVRAALRCTLQCSGKLAILYFVRVCVCVLCGHHRFGTVRCQLSFWYSSRRLLSLCQFCICGSAQLRFTPSGKLIVLLIRIVDLTATVSYSVSTTVQGKKNKRKPQKENPPRRPLRVTETDD